MIHASVKSYRSALFAFRMNILNSIPILLEGHLPMSLIPMESLLAIMDSVRYPIRNGCDPRQELGHHSRTIGCL